MAVTKIPHKRTPRKDLSAKYVRSIFNYDKKTGRLVWKERNNVSPHINSRDQGKLAGWIEPKGYRAIEINSRAYKSHRIARLYVTGKWPKDQIDHINGVKADNSWKNLREATNKQNCRNQGPRKNNVSGYKGVNWRKRNQKWVALISDYPKRVHLGFFKTAKEAHEAYERAIKKVYGKFAFHG